MKATVPRSEAPKVKKAKAELRPSSAVPEKTANKKAAAPASSKLQKAPAPTKPASAKVAAPAPTKAKLPSASKPAAVKTTAGVASTPDAGAPSAKRPVSSKSATSKASASKAAPEPTAPASVAKKVARKSIKEAAGVSTDAVARRTGKTWDDWFDVLDSAGAATLDQRGIVAILAQKHGIGPWWQQMIAVGYESLRGKSEKPVAADGFQISESCTLSAPVARVFKLWNDASERARWLADDRFVVKSATPGKVLRARWGKGNSHVAVSFSEKAGKTEVALEHQQIESRAAADQMKAYWQKKLGLLDDALAARR